MARDNEIKPFQDLLQAIQASLETGDSATLVTVVGGTASVGAKLFITADGVRVGSLQEPRLDDMAAGFVDTFLQMRHEARTVSVSELDPLAGFAADTRMLFELIAPEPRLFVCGAGHVGAALARIGPGLGFTTTVIDDRPELLDALTSAGNDLQTCAITDWSTGVRAAIGNGRGAYVAIVTRGHREDEECLGAVLTLEPNYVGMIGSRRRTNIVLDRLRAAGFADETLRQVRAPIGLDIGAVTPAEVAVAIAAEIVAERRGGAGGPLSDWRRE
jgi:xanthine dehydrogenase accessory factor